MNQHQLQQMARAAGVPEQLSRDVVPGTRREPQLIRAIQRAQGMEDCFRTDRRYTCKNLACPWRGECMRLVARWLD